MTVHARAPLRIDFAGAWTDTAPFASGPGGRTVGAAISLSVRADILLGDQRIRLAAEDRDERVTIPSSGAIAYDGRLDLHKAALNMFPVTGGIEVITRSDVPVGSGLGAAAALEVALLAGLARCREERYDAEDLAEFAHALEVLELKRPGGLASRLLAALGGLRSIAVAEGQATTRTLAVDEAGVRQLAEHTILVFAGPCHLGAEAHRRVQARLERGDSGVQAAFAGFASCADVAVAALEAGDWERLGRCMTDHWRHQQAADSVVGGPRLEAVARAALDAGAWGGRATGLGAGGCFVALAPTSCRPAVEAAAANAGGQLLPVAFTREGVTVWETEGGP